MTEGWSEKTSNYWLESSVHSALETRKPWVWVSFQCSAFQKVKWSFDRCIVLGAHTIVYLSFISSQDPINTIKKDSLSNLVCSGHVFIRVTVLDTAVWTDVVHLPDIRPSLALVMVVVTAFLANGVLLLRHGFVVGRVVVVVVVVAVVFLNRLTVVMAVLVGGCTLKKRKL